MNKFQHRPQIITYRYQSTSGLWINSSPCFVGNASQPQGTCAYASTLTAPQTNIFKVKNTYYMVVVVAAFRFRQKQKPIQVSSETKITDSGSVQRVQKPILRFR
ncbi:hypothetical protein Hanom_Chr06g00546931 [Helianthus anomalus]